MHCRSTKAATLWRLLQFVWAARAYDAWAIDGGACAVAMSGESASYAMTLCGMVALVRHCGLCLWCVLQCSGGAGFVCRRYGHAHSNVWLLFAPPRPQNSMSE